MTQLMSVGPFLKEFSIVSLSLLNELHAFTHPARLRGPCMKMCYSLSPNYLLFTLLLRTINLSLSIRLGAEFFLWVNNTICSFTAVLLAAELALDGWMT